MKTEKLVARGLTRKERKEMEAVFRFAREHIHEVERDLEHERRRRSLQADPSYPFRYGGCRIR